MTCVCVTYSSFLCLINSLRHSRTISVRPECIAAGDQKTNSINAGLKYEKEKKKTEKIKIFSPRKSRPDDDAATAYPDDGNITHALYYKYGYYTRIEN